MSEAFKTNKNKVFVTVIIVIGVIFLIGIIVSRAYNINQGEASLQDVSVPQEEIVLPKEESNVEHLENAQAEDNTVKMIEDPHQAEENIKSVTGNKDLKGQSDQARTVTFKEPTIDKPKKEKTDYYQPEKKTKKPEPVPVPVEKPVVQEQQVAVKKPAFGTVYQAGGTTKAVVNKSDMGKAVIHSDQALGNGQSAIIRLTQNFTLSNGTELPKNSILYGVVNYGEDRVLINVRRAITPQKGEVVVNLDVYDNDYIKGIFYQTEIDKGVNQNKDDSQQEITNDVSTNGGAVTKGVVIATKLAQKAINNTSQTLKKNRKLKLQEGYILYIKEAKQ